AIIAWLFPAWNLVIVLVTILAVMLVLRALSAGKAKPLANGIATCNLTCSVPPIEAKRGTIVYIAHHDTKSQALAAIKRVICFIGWAATLFAGLGIFAIMGILHLFMIGNVMPPSSQGALDVLSFFVDGVVIAFTCFTIPLVFNKIGNNSPGALDNASGVAAIYVLAKQLKAHPFTNIEARFVITGSEELGLYGAKEYVAKHGGELDHASTWVVNFDTICCKGAGIQVLEAMGFPIPRKISPFLSKVAHDAASRLGHDLRGLYIPIGAGTDRMVFTSHGYDGIDFGCRAAASVIHTMRDAPDRFDPAMATAVASIAHLMGKHLDGTTRDAQRQ
nr:M28 family peptidase [Candidatus Sigynarchaeota archaeon]